MRTWLGRFIRLVRDWKTIEALGRKAIKEHIELYAAVGDRAHAARTAGNDFYKQIQRTWTGKEPPSIGPC